MSIINWLLIQGGEAVRWLGYVIADAFVWFFSLLDSILNPVLSPLLAVLNPVCTAVGDGVYAVLGLLPAAWGLVVISVVVGVLMLLAFQRLSNQAAIGRAKDDIKANLLALKLFKDELRVMFVCQARILWAILRLQRYVLTPVLWLALPTLLLLAQMGVRYQWRPIHSGEQTLLRVQFLPEADAPVSLDPGPGVVVEIGPVPGGGEVVWRLRAAADGRHTLRLTVGGQSIEKELVVGNGFERVSALRPADHWTDQLLHPCEPRLPSAAGIKRVVIDYPSRPSWISGSDYWVVTFLVVSMIAALALAPWFKVRF